MSNSTRYYRNPDFIFRNVAGEAVLIPLLKDVADLEAIYTLNEVGVFIWEQMETPISIKELKQKILAEFEVDEKNLDQDIMNFVVELKEARILLEAK
jgi:dynactin complex subunit